ncbi:MAG: hypothetical protein WC501_03190 [Candidatus Micrarchaeia archaeon]
MKIDLKVIMAIVLIGVFVLEYALMPFLNKQDVETGQLENYMGNGVFKATLEYYERTVYIQSSQYELLEKIKSNANVKDASFESGIYTVILNKREDVENFYKQMKDENIPVYATAIVTLEPSITIYDEQNNNITGDFYSRKTKIFGIEPVLRPESEIWLNGKIVIQSNQAFLTEDPTIYFQIISLDINATILDLEKYLEYIVPWRDRNSIDVAGLKQEYGIDNISYQKDNSVYFLTPLSIQEQISKKKDYIDYISDHMLIVADNFSDMELIKNDFGEELIFSNSTLNIIGIEDINLTFDKKEYNFYILKPEMKGYNVPQEYTELELSSDTLLEGEILITIQAIVTGNNIIKIENIELS